MKNGVCESSVCSFGDGGLIKLSFLGSITALDGLDFSGLGFWPLNFVFLCCFLESSLTSTSGLLSFETFNDECFEFPFWLYLEILLSFVLISLYLYYTL